MPAKLLRSINQYLYPQDEIFILIRPIITLINNTVGVAALAMPFCFHQCGILLSFLFLGITTAFSIMSCDALIDICSTHRVLPFEHACFKALGHMGKSLAELSVICLLFGYVVGYYVTIADLSTGVVSQIAVTMPTHQLRFILLVTFTVTLVPLCLVSKVQSLLRLNVFTSLFYGVVTFHFGFFGYVAFISSERTIFSGNVFLMYPDDLRSFCIRVGFLLTNIVSIPLIIFPLRQTVYNLLCQKRLTSFGVDLEIDSTPMISEEVPRRFIQKITISLLLVSFLLSLTTDKIEVIIRYTTSVAGSLTGFILPALVLIVATIKNGNHHHPRPHYNGSSSSSNSSHNSISRFLQIYRNHSISAYCLLLVGCLLFSLEFFTVHHTNNGNTNSLTNLNGINKNNLQLLSRDHIVDTTTRSSSSSSSTTTTTTKTVTSLQSNIVKVNLNAPQPILNVTMKNPPEPIDLTKIQSQMNVNNKLTNISSLIKQHHQQTKPITIINKTILKNFKKSR
ncbi:solute carrier family 38 (sodium-coupled neutral amino acid transporter), member 10 [Schistosoma bovis]|uniref:Solute carrier family 38 (Sodium-coupled neutral amino acid transporter), member 10 n=1 Tax=Schistosoma bovis TaxID=6184 RepID=A0A430QBD8_SCHBO|nr:solute carrier family 38 (sodium-coupled neutral amino acid transporter), member 10 [Schistosoma bovis]